MAKGEAFRQRALMYKKTTMFPLFLATVLLLLPAAANAKKKDKAASETGEVTGTPILWREPTDITSRNLMYGPGGMEHQPHGTFTFVKEDMDGTNPKFIVRGEDGVKWKIKLGSEAKPETVATRMLWAAGYFVGEDYFLPDVQVKNMPRHLHRGQKLVEPDGTMHDVRLKRYLEGEKKVGIWEWRNNPFTGTREFNGLRVLMAVINNWDLKDANNAIHREKSQELVYMVSDLGASFGTTRYERSHEKAKGNLDSYTKSKFILKTNDDFVDFDDPHRPAGILVANPREFASRLNMEWIGKHIPRADAQWMGHLLAKLSPEQIHDAFRSAGYGPEDVEGFSAILQSRIDELNKLQKPGLADLLKNLFY
jgi:hypothetical protein